MDIGIMVHSFTGNTRTVIESVASALGHQGHTVRVSEVTPLGGERPGQTDPSSFTFRDIADLEDLDAIVVAFPVRGADVSPVMKAYLAKVPTFAGKRVALVATEFFPFGWMGGKQALAKGEALCRGKGATVIGSGLVNWTSPSRDKQIATVVSTVAALFR